MEKRTIGIVGAFDRNGVYGIGPHLPWAGGDGRSLLKLDMARFVEITRRTVPLEGKQNVLVVGRGTMKAMDWHPLPGRHTIILSQTLTKDDIRAKIPSGKHVGLARNVQQAIDEALKLPDCGNILFGGGYDVWLQALKSGMCTHAFITVAMCDSVAMSAHQGEVRRAAEILDHATFPNMKVEGFQVSDIWGEQDIELEFRNYSQL
jgi:dihydrofolate reductase